MHKNWNDRFYAPDSGTIGAVEEGSLSPQDVIDLMGADDDTKDDDSIKDDKEPSSGKKEPEEKKEKEEVPELQLEDVDEVEIQDIPRRREILKQFPEIFKKFPGIEKAIYREQQYSELFPTITEAKSAIESVKQYKEFESSLLSGDLGAVLKAVKNADSDAFKKIGGNFLQTIASVDQESYYGVINEVLQHAIYGMASQAQTDNNDDLKIAAQILNEFVFHSKQIKQPTAKQVTQPNNDQQKLDNERMQFQQERLTAVIEDISSKAQNTIKSTVEKNIDPKNSMSAYVKSKAINDASDRMEQALLSDRRYMNMIDNLYAAAAKSGFDNASRTKIKNTIYTKAKAILPDIIREVRAEALKGSSSSRVAEEEIVEKKSTTNEPRTSSSKSEKNVPGRHEKTLDFFMRD